MLRLLLVLTCSVSCVASWAADGQKMPPETLVSWRNGALHLTRDDYLAALATMPEKARSDIQRDMKKITKLLEDLKLIRSLADDARKAGLDKDPRILTQMQIAAERMLAQVWFDQWTGDLKRPDFAKAAKDAYDMNPERFALPEQVRVAHVLIAPKSDNDGEAQGRAEEVRSKALAGGDFAALASEYSDDPGSKGKGGELGFMSRGQLEKPFEDAAFTMTKPGEISPVVKTRYGYHVIKFIERQPVRRRSFDELKNALVQREEAEFVQSSRALYVREITSDPTTTLNTQAIDRLHVHIGSKTPGEKNER